MTALNVFVQPEAVYLFTDGVGCGPDGTILSLQDKVHLFPHLSACVAIRGNVAHTRRINLALSEIAESFDALVDQAPGLAINAAAGLDSPHGGGFDMVLAGWSGARQAFEAYQLIYRGQALPTGWTSTRLRSLVSPHDQGIAEGMKAAGLEPGGRPPPIRELGRILLAVQRATPSTSLTGAPLRAVGGFNQMTTLSQDGVKVEVLDRWPEDRIGSLVGGDLPAPARHPGREGSA